ncbi:MAG: S41 family peptidase [Bacteroidota bacterium]
MKRIRQIIIVALLALFSFLISCEEEKVESPEKDAAENFHELMQSWYLWYDEMPEIDPSEYSSPEGVLEDVRYKNDYWSYITTVEEFEQYYKEGSFTGYGFGYNTDTADNIRITFTYEESPLREEGIKRSWIIDKIDGEKITSKDHLNELLGNPEVGESNAFSVHSPSGDTVNQTFTVEEIKKNTILHDSIIEQNSNKIGYMVLNSFIENTSGELYDVFQNFSEQNIDEIIIDLRYNGGGMLSSANELADYIIEDDNIDEIFAQIMHNDKKEDENVYHYLKQDSLSLNWSLPKVYFITTGSTASASEALINGLKPYTEVYTIGKQTYGKPVGMYGFYDNKDYYAFVPVCFRIANANEVADYYEGIPVDVEEIDDITQKFGSPEEASLKQALNHIETGSFIQNKTVRTLPKPVLGPSHRKEMIKVNQKPAK